MRWIDMHCDTLSEIAKQMKTDENTKESLEALGIVKNSLGDE